MKPLRLLMAVGLAALLTVLPRAEQGANAQTPEQGAARGGGQGGRAGGAGRGAADGKVIGGTLTPAKADARGWGWQVKASMNAATPRPLYNKAKELLLQDKQITSYTLSTYNPELYCELRKHFDYIWFEMQHSTMSYDEVRRMLLACPGSDGAAPMIRTPDALESTIQKVTDLGAIGLIVPTVDDALEARTFLARAFERTLDALDQVGDSIATAVGLR
jgi:hypothetical protein